MKILLQNNVFRQNGKKIRYIRKHGKLYGVMLSGNHLPVAVFYSPNRDMHLQIERPLYKQRLFSERIYFKHNSYHTRGMSLIAVRLLRGALKIRYLVLGSAIGGGVTLQKAYQDWKDALPDLTWMSNYMPKVEEWDNAKKFLLSFKEKLKEFDEIGSDLQVLAGSKWNSSKEWLTDKLDEAYLAASQDEQNNVKNSVDGAVTINALSFKQKEENLTTENSKRSSISEDDVWETQMKYQKELERLERENKELRKQLLLKAQSGQPVKKVKLSLIDMYSDVLDELSDYDISYEMQDHLPRVVVIGDQSSGKTSVLEMIAQARIFPRGAGEMMTRSPVKVTLSEGPYHIAQFKDSSREFDLTKESDLSDLRREVELRMRNVVTRGRTVSHEVISMTVKGPGLQRMVLVDLPGIISTNTLGMSINTKDEIYEMTKHYMSNPNAIILCIQDGSVDAERSNVTDLVSKMDPQGRRTILVLTKVDVAEENLANPDRIRKILAGELFPMKALGYFAVVTGKGAKNESIQQIKTYEESFFRNSKLFNNKVIKSSQMTTRNLSLAVSECFWKMVRETVEQQADAFKAQRFNLETEWKNRFPRLRILDRNELFEKARSEILDEVINLSEVPVKQWEDLISTKLWDKVSDFVFENIYFTAAAGQNGEFNTKVDIKLYQWAEQELPQVSVEAGWETLQQEFRQLIENTKLKKDHDDVFDMLKYSVVEEALKRHKWEAKACDVLRVIQTNALEDQTISDKPQWDSAVKFLENSVKQELQKIEKTLNEMLGPSLLERWYMWKYASEESVIRVNVKAELDKILSNNPEHTCDLDLDELTTVRNTLQRSNVNVDNDFIMNTWIPIYRRHILKKTLDKIPYYMRGFYLHRQGIEPQEYNEVILFWRIQQMLKVTVNSLRQQIVNREAHRLDEEIKEVLEDFGKDQDKKETLLTGRRVTLAEELKRVKQIQEKLEDFIKALNKEKNENRRIT